jgi:choline dehydrogenase-like flavoprotein
VTSATKHFDAIIIGTGQAGPPLAARFAGTGKTVSIIEAAVMMVEAAQFNGIDSAQAGSRRILSPHALRSDTL